MSTQYWRIMHKSLRKISGYIIADCGFGYLEKKN
jgi:hypothetical protein